MIFKPSNLAVYVCNHVFEKTREIKLVAHEYGGDWQFLCGEEDHDGQDVHVVGVGHLTGRDKTLYQVEDLPEGWEAERNDSNSPWVRTQFDDED